jgi:predicted DNA-binding transcriptional regulator YafY
MRAERLISIVLLLQIHRRMTASELAERLEVSERTIYRDMDTLSMAGIPVVADRGIGGGWYLLDGYKTTLTGLNQAEIQTLFLPRPICLLEDLGLEEASEAADLKLLAALPSTFRQDAEYIRQRIHIDLSGWRDDDESVAFLPVLQESVWQERKILLTYHLSTGPIVEPVLDPLGLVARGSVWYLVALFDEEPCVYRVSRVLDAHLLDAPCDRPDDFDLAEFWAASSAEYRASLSSYAVTARLAPTAVPHLKDQANCHSVKRIGTQDKAGWYQVEFTFASETEACGYLFRFGAQVRVVKPLALHARIVELAQAFVGTPQSEQSSPEGKGLALAA